MMNFKSISTALALCVATSTFAQTAVEEPKKTETQDHWSESVNQFLDSLKLSPAQIQGLKTYWNKVSNTVAGSIHQDLNAYVNKTGNVVAYVDTYSKTKHVIAPESLTDDKLVSQAFEALSNRKLVVIGKDGKEDAAESKKLEGKAS